MTAHEPWYAKLAGTLVEHYRLEKRLGYGAMGAVYLAIHQHLSNTVAVKVMDPRVSDFLTQRGIEPTSEQAEQRRQSCLARFRREARIGRSLGGHPNLLRVLDPPPSAEDVDYVYTSTVTPPKGQPRELCWIAMEYLDGEPLKPTIAREWFPRISMEIARAVEHLHAFNFAHRDIKPANVLRTRRGIVLIDYGVASVPDSDIGTDWVGTRGYMPDRNATRAPIMLNSQ